MSSEEDDDDEEEKEFRERLKKFTSSFCLNDAIKSKEKASSEFQKLYEELAEGYATREEEVRTKNLLCYLQWELCERKAALDYCESVLELDHQNIIALSNKTWFMIYLKEFSEAKRILEFLGNLSRAPAYKILQNNAKAELAYCYSRFGPRFHRKSIGLFEEAIAEDRENELWKFGLALTYRRQTHILNSPSSSKTEVKTFVMKALILLHEITSSETNAALRAKAWCEMGQILHEKSQGLKFHHLPQSIKSLRSEECFRNALKTYPEDVFVLQRCGRYFRYFSKLDVSKDLLEKAVAIRETPFNLHHLAITLVKQLEAELKHGRQLPRTSTMNQSTDLVHFEVGPRNPVIHKVHHAVDCITEGMASLNLNARPIQGTYKVKYDNEQKEKEMDISTGNTQTLCYSRGRGQSRGIRRHFQDSGRGRGRHVPSDYRVNRMYIKSPMKTVVARNNPLLKKAESCLKQAIALTQNHFPNASYELGLVYRKLDQIEDAIKMFNDVSLAKDSSKLEKVRALEQIGICKRRLAESRDCSPEDAARYNSDAKTILFKAVRHMASLCSTLPDLENTLSCYPTLLSMLSERKPFFQVNASKEVADLHQLLGHYKEAIPFYEEVRAIMRQNTPGDVLLQLVKSYRATEDYENAVSLLNLLWCSSDHRKLVTRDSYVMLHIDAWEHNVKTKDYDQAIHYLQDAYQVVIRNVRDSDPKTREGARDSYSRSTEVVVLCSCDDKCDIYSVIKENLEKLCGLGSTLNSDDCLPGRDMLNYFEEILNDSEVILLLIHDQKVSSPDDYHIQMTLSDTKLQEKAVVVADEVAKPTLCILPRLELPKEDTVMCDWIRRLLVSVLLK